MSNFKKIHFFTLILAIPYLTACQSSSLEKSLIGQNPLPDEDYLITIKTDYGEMKAILFDKTPKHKKNFIKLAKEGFYDGTLFHRIIDGFMIQGGDPDSKTANAGDPLGQGDPGYTIPAEFHPDLHHVRGAIAAARQGDQVNPNKESNGSQFYIIHGKKLTIKELEQFGADMDKLQKYFFQLIEIDSFQKVKETFFILQNQQNMQGIQNLVFSQKDTIEKIFQVDLKARTWTEKEIQNYIQIGGTPFLDQKYTVFGLILTGLEAVDKIVKENKDKRDRPYNDIKMKVSVETIKKSEITKKYGYQYD